MMYAKKERKVLAGTAWSILALAVMALQGPAAMAAPPGDAEIGTRWVKTLSEDFDGPLDDSVWTLRDIDDRPNGNNGVTWGWAPENVTVQDGNLVIRTSSDGDGTYSSGNAWTKDKWSQTYGYFEARVKLPPAGNGHQAAFWMVAQGDGHFVVGNDGRDGAEIDILESPDASDHYRMAVHWDGYDAYHQVAAAQASAPGIHEGYHDFGVAWDANTLKYYYDGQLTWTYSGVGVPRVAEVLQLSVGILNWCDGDIRAAELPQYTYFDRVYAWQLQTDEAVQVVDDTSDAILLTGSDWQQEGSSGDYQGTMMQSGQAGDAAVFEFEGTGVDVFVRRGLYGGLVDVYLDDQLVAEGIDTYANAQDFQHLLYTADALDPGLHVLRLEVTGQANPDSVGSLLMLDAIQYTPVPEPATLSLLALGGLALLRRRRRA